MSWQTRRNFASHDLVYSELIFTILTDLQVLYCQTRALYDYRAVNATTMVMILITMGRSLCQSASKMFLKTIITHLRLTKHGTRWEVYLAALGICFRCLADANNAFTIFDCGPPPYTPQVGGVSRSIGDMFWVSCRCKQRFYHP
jgi:hypothetical protein